MNNIFRPGNNEGSAVMSLSGRMGGLLLRLSGVSEAGRCGFFAQTVPDVFKPFPPTLDQTTHSRHHDADIVQDCRWRLS